MFDDRFAALPPYAFPRLRTLLDGTEAGSNQIINLSIGEPKHPFPTFVTDVLAREALGYNKYPPNQGTPNWQASVTGWLNRRYNLPDGLIEATRNILPLNGTREGLFQAAIALVPARKNGQQPTVLMPNPFYQCYAAAAIAAGAQPVFLDAAKATGFMPDLDAIDADVLDRAALFYLCSPANPQGAVASRAYPEKLIGLAREHNFIVALDECYSEIYLNAAPVGGLDVAARSDAGLANVLVFHSLSKRSNLPGLRSGFVAGDGDLIARFSKVRSYGGAPSPIPVYEAAAAAWDDEDHVIQNRLQYAAKFKIADRLLAGKYNYAAPEGGFFLWLDVGDGEAATKALWAKAGVRVLPGGYLSHAAEDGTNPGAPYIRVAMVDAPDVIETALEKMIEVLG